MALYSTGYRNAAAAAALGTLPDAPIMDGCVIMMYAGSRPETADAALGSAFRIVLALGPQQVALHRRGDRARINGVVAHVRAIVDPRNDQVGSMFEQAGDGHVLGHNQQVRCGQEIRYHHAEERDNQQQSDERSGLQQVHINHIFLVHDGFQPD